MTHPQPSNANAEPQASRPYMPEYELLAAHEGRGLLAWRWAEERLRNANRYWLATTRPDGRPHLTAVWGIWMDTAFYFSTGCQTRKARNLAQQTHCVVTPEDAAEAVIVEGVATLISDAQLLEQVATLYQQKYKSAYPENSCVYRVAPQTGFGFIEDGAEFAGTATRWQWNR